MDDELGSEDLLTLQALAKISGCPLSQIRRYEAEGLVVAVRELGRRGRVERLYARTQVRRVRRIRSYQTLGVNLAGIEMILRLLEQVAPGRSER